MKITKLISELQDVLKREGDIEVTCTGCLQPDSVHGLDGTPFETTVENLMVMKPNETFKEKRVRVYL